MSAPAQMASAGQVQYNNFGQSWPPFWQNSGSRCSQPEELNTRYHYKFLIGYLPNFLAVLNAVTKFWGGTSG